MTRLLDRQGVDLHQDETASTVGTVPAGDRLSKTVQPSLQPGERPRRGRERRAHRRMEIRLPVACRRRSSQGPQVVRSVTRNISSGGLYVEVDTPGLQVGDRLQMELTVPPAEGVSPYEGRASCRVQVARVDHIERHRTGRPARPGFGIAAQFLDRLRFSY